MLPKKRIWK